MENKVAGEPRRQMRREAQAQHFDAIKAHVERYVGHVAQVFEMTDDDGGTLSLLHVRTRRPAHHQVIVTSGISDTLMPVPNDMEDFERAELLLALPRDWPVLDGIWRDGDLGWPLRWLEYVGRLPLRFDTWIGWGHSIPNGHPATPIANTAFTGVCLAPPYWLEPAFFQLRANSGDTICFYDLVPVYAEEMQLKLDRGFGELEKCFEKAGTGFILDVNRSNVAT